MLVKHKKLGKRIKKVLALIKETKAKKDKDIMKCFELLFKHYPKLRFLYRKGYIFPLGKITFETSEEKLPFFMASDISFIGASVFNKSALDSLRNSFFSESSIFGSKSSTRVILIQGVNLEVIEVIIRQASEEYKPKGWFFEIEGQSVMTMNRLNIKKKNGYEYLVNN